jgi:hypothetical protein
MSLIKREYSYISFPLKHDWKNSQLVLADYIKEFSHQGVLRFEDFIALTLNVMNDFFTGRISEKLLENILNFTYSFKETKNFHLKPYLWEHNQLLGFISELGDVTWLMQSPTYEEYKKTARKKFEDLVEKYEDSAG